MSHGHVIFVCHNCKAWKVMWSLVTIVGDHVISCIVGNCDFV